MHWLLPAVFKCVFIFEGLALIDAGEAMRELAEVKDALDMEVKQNFIDPLQNLHEKDLKEIQVQSADFFFFLKTMIIIYDSSFGQESILLV